MTPFTFFTHMRHEIWVYSKDSDNFYEDIPFRALQLSSELVELTSNATNRITDTLIERRSWILDET